ncbi:Odorant receptor 380 [Nylanderia fulva]|uniref:Odorant receptor n=1 Tax=Nylanderia fulva TaxID=613905 RepID=A0A6G1LQK9_9HYME|nr:Odorant receptor 380 [Nylanderia fulva]
MDVSAHSGYAVSLFFLLSVLSIKIIKKKKKNFIEYIIHLFSYIFLIPVLKMVKEDWTRSKTEEEREIMIRRAQTARLIMKWGYFVMFISYILVVIFPSFGISLRYLTNITDPGRLMPLQTYYMYNTNESPLYEITFFLQGLSLMATANTYTNTDTFMGGLVFHVCGQLENLKARILNVEFHRFEDSLSANVQEHARLMRSIKIIDDTFTLMLLGLLIYFGILFALYGYLFVTIITQGRNLSIARLIYILISFINTFTHMFLHCAVGELGDTDKRVNCEGLQTSCFHYLLFSSLSIHERYMHPWNKIPKYRCASTFYETILLKHIYIIYIYICLCITHSSKYNI